MDMITNSYDNVPMSQLYSKISQKYAELRKIDSEEQISKVSNTKTDYIDSASSTGKYDEQDFERVLAKFKKSDADIRTHEQTHATIGATTSPISYNYQQGPDGKMYAVGGSVRLDTSIPKDKEAAIAKLDQISRSVSGVSDPSGADMAISTQANLNKILLQSRGDENASS
ncbi:MAG: putative metalloprotease CJM1_0395 family protein [Campylobacterota bacterium]|nr:putative metalloprotease CJM1_0395 family protein [Campylobacterota bacterium]